MHTIVVSGAQDGFYIISIEPSEEPPMTGIGGLFGVVTRPPPPKCVHGAENVGSAITEMLQRYEQTMEARREAVRTHTEECEHCGDSSPAGLSEEELADLGIGTEFDA